MWILSLPQWLYGGPLLRSLLSPPYLEMSSYILGWVWIPEHSLELKMYSWMTLWSKKFKITEFFSWKFALSRRATRLHIGAFTILFSRDTSWPNSTLPFVFTQFSFFFFLKPNLFPPPIKPHGLNLVIHCEDLWDAFPWGVPMCCSPSLPAAYVTARHFPGRAHCRPQVFLWGIEIPLPSLPIKMSFWFCCWIFSFQSVLTFVFH